MARYIFLATILIGLGIVGRWQGQWQRLVKPANLVHDQVKGIPSLLNPDFESVRQADAWLDRAEEVVGLFLNGEARAYSTKILQYHELINDRLGKTSLVVWYYPPTGQAHVYQSNDLTLGLTNLVTAEGPVALDKPTRFRWNFSGAPFDNQSEKLTSLPFGRYEWGRWRTIFPQTTVMSRPRGYAFDYSQPARPLPSQSVSTNLPDVSQKEGQDANQGQLKP